MTSTQPDQRQFQVPCLASGSFGAMPGTLQTQGCVRVPCGEPANHSHASVSPGVRYYGDTALYSCDSGYTIDGTIQGAASWEVTCGPRGFSSPLATSCQRVGVKVSGVIQDRTTGDGIPNAQVKLETPDAEPIASGMTTSTGRFTLDSVPLGLGSLVLNASAENFMAGQRSLNITSDGVDVVGVTLALSPQLSASGYHFVLTWGNTPKDLDLVLFVGRCAMGKRFRGRTECMPGITATVDATTDEGNGPEIITVEGVNGATCPRTCWIGAEVKRASSDSNSWDGAEFKIYKGHNEIGRFQAPNDGAFSTTMWYPGRLLVQGDKVDVAACTSLRCV